MLSSIQVRQKDKREKMFDESRINFGKMYTVEHNVKVYDFGDVRKSSLSILVKQWRWVLENNRGRDELQRAPLDKEEEEEGDSGEEENDDEEEAGGKEGADITLPAHGLALWPWSDNTHGQLEYEKGDNILVSERADDNWGRGNNLRTGKNGIFARNYVSINGPELPIDGADATISHQSTFVSDNARSRELATQDSSAQGANDKISNPVILGSVATSAGLISPFYSNTVAGNTSLPTGSGYASLPTVEIFKGTTSRSKDALIKVPGGSSISQVDQGPSHSQWGDAETLYSDTSSLPTTNKSNFITQFAHKLMEDISSNSSLIKSLQRISDFLPEMLRAFALKFGYTAETQQHRDTMVFVHKNRV